MWIMKASFPTVARGNFTFGKGKGWDKPCVLDWGYVCKLMVWKVIIT